MQFNPVSYYTNLASLHSAQPGFHREYSTLNLIMGNSDLAVKIKKSKATCFWVLQYNNDGNLNGNDHALHTRSYTLHVVFRTKNNDYIGIDQARTKAEQHLTDIYHKIKADQENRLLPFSVLPEMRISPMGPIADNFYGLSATMSFKEQTTKSTEPWQAVS